MLTEKQTKAIQRALNNWRQHHGTLPLLEVDGQPTVETVNTYRDFRLSQGYADTSWPLTGAGIDQALLNWRAPAPQPQPEPEVQTDTGSPEVAAEA